MTVPGGQKPPTGWPFVIFNHATSHRLSIAQRTLYRPMWIRSRQRLHRLPVRLSRPRPVGRCPPEACIPGPTTRSTSSRGRVAKTVSGADRDRIGMWGHSMVGTSPMRSMWLPRISRRRDRAGVVGTLPDLFTRGTWAPGRRNPSPDRGSIAAANVWALRKQTRIFGKSIRQTATCAI